MRESASFIEKKRIAMIDGQLKSRGISNPKVIETMFKVNRHLFLSENRLAEAYEDYPIPIGYGQTISQPYIVAFMTELCELHGTEKVLEVGTGSGYQAAILANLARQVYTIECVEPLAKTARARLAAMGYDNISVLSGDGYFGFAEQAPFDVIVLTAAPKEIPGPLIAQLADPGTLIAPIGDFSQDLVRVNKTAGRLIQERLIAVRFVPMVHTDRKGSKF